MTLFKCINLLKVGGFFFGCKMMRHSAVLIRSPLEKLEWCVGEKLWLLNRKECYFLLCYLIQTELWFIFIDHYILGVFPSPQGKYQQMICWVWNGEKVPELFIFALSSFLSTLSQGGKVGEPIRCFAMAWSVPNLAPFLDTFCQSLGHALSSSAFLLSCSHASPV